jgi:enoyl-CoA hydratase/carnithine racemase
MDRTASIPPVDATAADEPVEAGPPILTLSDAVATITLNRPQHRNRLHDEDLRQLLEHFARIDADRSIRVMVLTGRVLPPRPVFCAGYHIGEFNADREPDVSFEAVAQALERLRPITICALPGSVYGGATDLALACDFRLGVQGMELHMPAGALGLHYYPSGMRRYVSRMGLAAAKKAFLTALPLSAEDLLAVGYLDELWPPDELATETVALCARICALAPLAIEDMKQSLNEIARGEYDEARLRQRELHSRRTADFAEGRAAFLERRPARFQGR